MGGGTAAIFQLLLVEAIDYAEREVPLGIIFVLIKAEVVDASSLIVIECVERSAVESLTSSWSERKLLWRPAPIDQ